MERHKVNNIDSLGLSPTPSPKRERYLSPEEIGRVAATIPVSLKRPDRNYISANVASAIHRGRPELNRALLQSPPVIDMYQTRPFCSLHTAAVHPCPERLRPLVPPSPLRTSSLGNLMSSIFEGYQNADLVRSYASTRSSLNDKVENLPLVETQLSEKALLRLHSSLSNSLAESTCTEKSQG